VTLTGTPAHTAPASATQPDTAPDRLFHEELTNRNAGVISNSTQEKLRTSEILIAGCGSIGGAAAEPLARLGAGNLLLADPGDYELNNLNRQNATVTDIGRNKAVVAAERIRAINPQAKVEVFTSGITPGTVEELTSRAKVIVDGVDVTTKAGLEAKVLLHEHALIRRLPLITGWDMAGAQYVRCYDYRRISRIFDGQVTAADLNRLTLWQFLQRLVPARYVPSEMTAFARANLGNSAVTFPQLVYAADMFGAISAHAVAQLLTGARIGDHVYVDVHQLVRPAPSRWLSRIRRPVEAVSLLFRLHRTS
jgi:hypothetical protein